jgi:hypothetical protein
MGLSTYLNLSIKDVLLFRDYRPGGLKFILPGGLDNGRYKWYTYLERRKRRI